MRHLIPVENHPDLHRDPNSKAIICTTTEKLVRHREKVAREHAEAQRIDTIESRLNNLDSKMDKILELLSK